MSVRSHCLASACLSLFSACSAGPWTCVFQHVRAQEKTRRCAVVHTRGLILAPRGQRHDDRTRTIAPSSRRLRMSPCVMLMICVGESLPRAPGRHPCATVCKLALPACSPCASRPHLNLLVLTLVACALCCRCALLACGCAETRCPCPYRSTRHLVVRD